jgi:hypothetical protein
MEHTCTYATDNGDLVIEFCYQPAERATLNEPGCDEAVEVWSVRAGDFEILEWCSKDSIAFFEEKALESVADSRHEAEYDRADDRYQSRKDDEAMAI